MMSRRHLLAPALAVMVSAGTGASSAGAAVSSPILDVARQIAALNLQHEQADVPHADGRTLGAIWEQIWAHERFILDATPATVTEAMVVLMVAAGNLDMASCSDDTGTTVRKATHAVSRATRFLAGTAGVTVEEFGGDLYLMKKAA